MKLNLTLVDISFVLGEQPPWRDSEGKGAPMKEEGDEMRDFAIDDGFEGLCNLCNSLTFSFVCVCVCVCVLSVRFMLTLLGGHHLLIWKYLIYLVIILEVELLMVYPKTQLVMLVIVSQIDQIEESLHRKIAVWRYEKL